MQNLINLTPLELGLDLLLLSLFFASILITIGTFIKWIKPSKSGFSTKHGLTLEFDKNNVLKENNINPLSLYSCIEDSTSFKNELILVISKSIRFGYEISMLKEISTVRSQMNSLQVKADLIENIFLKEFSSKLISFNVDKETSRFTNHIFNQFMSSIIKADILDEMKVHFKQNGLQEITNEDFENIYCKDRVKKILTNLRMSIKTHLPDNLNPPISEVVEIFDRYETSIGTYIKEGFYEAKEIAHKYHLEEEKRKIQFDQEITEATGITQASKSGK
jgi:hypothetical protein